MNCAAHFGLINILLQGEKIDHITASKLVGLVGITAALNGDEGAIAIGESSGFDTEGVRVFKE